MALIANLPNGPLRVWLDDRRQMPAHFNVHVRTLAEAREVLSTGRVEVISLDHDLGTNANGHDVACIIERGAFFGTLPRLNWGVHSANAVGHQRIVEALRRADSYWDDNERQLPSDVRR